MGCKPFRRGSAPGGARSVTTGWAAATCLAASCCLSAVSPARGEDPTCSPALSDGQSPLSVEELTDQIDRSLAAAWKRDDVEPAPPADDAPPPVRAEAPAAVRVGPRPERLPDPSADRLPELKTGASPGVGKRTALRLKRGQLAIEGRIDLHGMTQDKAHRALEGFLTASQAAGKRCVLVITGKGLRPTGETGVLRNLVPRWMNAPAIRGRVLGFSTAQPRDGGTGALYVLLKRKR